MTNGSANDASHCSGCGNSNAQCSCDKPYKKIRKLEAENAKLKELCRQVVRFYESVGTVLDADMIRKSWHGSSTKAEIKDILCKE